MDKALRRYFVLHEILRVDAANIWQSLLAFNLGVEIGHLAIVLVTWPAIISIGKMSLRAWRCGRISLATACIAVAGFWAIQRVGFAVSNLL
ncbi:HupE/UreJ family protein [Methylocystis sp.]|uniref:HupE/UreJ family protein n=1 Tax=Methylocystis sp. TaxID=1911079 RepID=UPI00345BD6CB